MSETNLGRRDLLLASGAVLAGAGAVARARLSDLGHEVVSAYLTRGEAGIPGTEAAGLPGRTA